MVSVFTRETNTDHTLIIELEAINVTLMIVIILVIVCGAACIYQAYISATHRAIALSTTPTAFGLVLQEGTGPSWGPKEMIVDFNLGTGI